MENSLSTDSKTLELLARLKKGDAFAFEEINEKYRTVIDSAASKTLHSMEKAGITVGAETLDDLRQEARLALYRAALAYRLEQDEVEFGLFAKVCMTNRMIDKLRALSRTEKTEVLDEAEDAALDPAARVLDAEAVASLNALIDGNLSAYERRVFKWYLSGYSAREIAQAAERDEKSVTNAIYRIKRKLKKILQS